MFGLIRSSWPFLLLGCSFAVIATMALVSILGQAFGLIRIAPKQDWLDIIGPLVVVGTFGPVAVLLLLLIWWYWIDCRSERKLQNQFPGKQWLHRSDWKNNLSRHYLKPRAIAYCGIAISANSLTIGAFSIFLIGKEKGGELSELIGLCILFAGFAALTLLGGLYALWLSYDAILLRGVTCHLIASPFRPGDAVRAVIRFTGPGIPKTPITVTLECTSTSTTRGKVMGTELGEAETFHRIHYQASFFIDEAVSCGDRKIDVPVRFNLPKTVPDTDTHGSATWDLSLRWGSIGKLAHSVDFELPIFRLDNVESLEESKSFDQCFYQTNLLGFPSFARPCSLKESIESFGGMLDHGDKSTWVICLPRGNGSGISQYVISGCGALVFLGGGLLVGGVSGLALAGLPWICLVPAIRMQRLCFDGLQLMYQQDSFWRRQTVSVNISDIKSVGYRQKERSNEGIGVHQVTAELTSGRCIILLTNAKSPSIAAGIAKRLNIAIQSQKVD